MKHTTSTDLRKRLSAMMGRVTEDHEPVLVTRAGGKPVVMIALEDYEAMDETRPPICWRPRPMRARCATPSHGSSVVR